LLLLSLLIDVVKVWEVSESVAGSSDDEANPYQSNFTTL